MHVVCLTQHLSLWNFKQEFLFFMTVTPLFASQACQCLLCMSVPSRRVLRKINFNAWSNRFFWGGGCAERNCCHMSQFWWQCQYLLVYVKLDTLSQLKSGGWLMSDRWGSPSLPLCWNMLLFFHMSLAVNFKSLQVWFWGLHNVPSHSLSSVILAALIFRNPPHQNQLQTRP